MKINENDLLPNSEVFVLENGEPTKKKIEDFFKNKKVILFGFIFFIDSRDISSFLFTITLN